MITCKRHTKERLWWEREYANKEVGVRSHRDKIAREHSELSPLVLETLKASLKFKEKALEKIHVGKGAAEQREKDARRHAIRDWELKQKEEEDERNEAERRALEAADRRKRNQKEEEKRVLAEYECRKTEQKEEEENTKLQFKLEDEKFRAEMRRRLAKFGFLETKLRLWSTRTGSFHKLI